MEKKLEPGFRGWGRTNAGGAKDRCATTTQPGSEKTAWKCQETVRPCRTSTRVQSLTDSLDLGIQRARLMLHFYYNTKGQKVKHEIP